MDPPRRDGDRALGRDRGDSPGDRDRVDDVLRGVAGGAVLLCVTVVALQVRALIAAESIAATRIAAVTLAAGVSIGGLIAYRTRA